MENLDSNQAKDTNIFTFGAHAFLSGKIGQKSIGEAEYFHI